MATTAVPDAAKPITPDEDEVLMVSLRTSVLGYHILFSLKYSSRPKWDTQVFYIEALVHLQTLLLDSPKCVFWLPSCHTTVKLTMLK